MVNNKDINKSSHSNYILNELLNNGQWNEIIKYSDKAKNDKTYNEQLSILEWKAKQMLGYSEIELLKCLRDGMLCNPTFYELYVCLADMKLNLNDNPNQAYICLEQALFYCDNDDDRDQIISMIDNLDVNVNPTSIVIASYNCCELMQLCIKSIREYIPSSAYEIIVVDNASTDGITEWLASQKDIRLIRNTENKGFGAASNQGVALASPNNDIFFLNNDTIVPPNAFFWLKMGLYENENIGATSCMSNKVSNQQRIDVSFNTTEEMLSFSKKHNIISFNPYEEKVKLIGFALLIKRNVLNKIGCFDEIFGIGNFEDDDISVRIIYEGYKLLLCHNSFIYHFGSQSFSQINLDYDVLLTKNRRLFKIKWGFDILYYTYARNEILQLIEDYPADKELNVLEIGCGAGATLNRIKYLWPNAKTYGVEIVENVAKLANIYSPVIAGDIENCKLPYDEGFFDIIICGDVLEHLRDPDAALIKFNKLLKSDGVLLASIPNVMHSSVIFPLLEGRWDYQDAGILDSTHLKFFTRKSILEMFNRTNYSIESMYMTTNIVDGPETNPELLKKLKTIMNEDAIEQLYAYQYILRAKKL